MEIKLPTAEELNKHLENGGRVVVANRIYTKKCAGMFFNGKKTGKLYVKRGKTSDCIEYSNITVCQ